MLENAAELKFDDLKLENKTMGFTRSNERDLPPKKGQEGFSLRFSILVFNTRMFI